MDVARGAYQETGIMLDSLSVSGGTGGLLLALGGIAVLAILVAVLRRRKRRGHHTLIAGHRLAVVDQIPIDETRRLVLIQRDEVQHLVILGGGSDFLVESGIGAVRAHDAPHPLVAEPVPVRPSRPLAAGSADAEAGSTAQATPVAPPPAKPTHTPFQTLRPPPGSEPARPRPAAPARPDTAGEPAPARPSTSAGAAERTEAGQRVAVKLDPFFAGMVDQLEETLRRPAATRGAQVGAAVAATMAATTVAAAPVAATEVTAAPAAPAQTPPEVQPVVAASEPAASAAPIPEILPPNAAARDQAPSPEVLPPTVEDRPASGDLFEQEMASLLGRTRRP